MRQEAAVRFDLCIGFLDVIHGSLATGVLEVRMRVAVFFVIVDIVETGATLRENKLEVVEKFVDISARLIANKSSFQFNKEKIEEIRDGLAKQTEK